jgi:hypothetical protein
MTGCRFTRLLARLIGLLASTGAVCGGGVTLVTHGYNSNVDSWVIAMADQIPGHPAFTGSDFSCYQVDITDVGGQLSGAATFLGGTSPVISDSGEIFIKLDWGAVSGGSRTSTEVAQAAVEALVSGGLIPELAGRALAELPLHLIGHSRGGSVVTEMARFCGAQGIWVDQVTTLDPVDNTFGDATAFVWENILYADNYWQTEALFGVVDGRSVSGSFNRFLSGLSGGNGGSFGSHSDVHLWYHGTIDLGTPASDTLASINQTERDSWWVAAESQGATAGFHYSRIGGGDRLGTLEPLGAGTGMIRDGYNKMWDLGAGTDAGSRSMLPANTGEWANVIVCGLADTTVTAAGGAFDLALHYQSGPTGAGAADLRVLLDPDRNPWNGNEVEVDQRMLVNTGTAVVLSPQIEVLVGGSVLPGTYAVATRISEGGRTRYLYAPGSFTVTPSEEPPRIDGSTVRIEEGLMKFTVRAVPGQTVSIRASENLGSWETIAILPFIGDTWEFTDPDTAMFPRRFYKAQLE